ncbi:MAG: DAK2 domain-containing protein [Lachnospiraceae bacterium]
MANRTIDANALQKMFLAGASRIEREKEKINELNVFPVPDGDTGTNMSMTIMAAAKEVAGLENPTMKQLAKAISSGSLRGARGNSGVILSQLLRGFTKEIELHEKLGVQEIAKGFTRAVETAYRAVMKPKEGTILTVARVMSEKAVEYAALNEDLEVYFKKILDDGYDILAKTTEMLPALKEANVVDSGGQGLMCVLNGGYDAYIGKESIPEIKVEKKVAVSSVSKPQPVSEADIKFGYCTEFIIMLENEFGAKEESEFKSFLMSIGDSLVVVSDDEIVKVHVHTNHPGLAFEKALTFGSLTRMKVDNMREEHQERLIKDAQKIAKQQAEEERLRVESQRQQEAKEVGFISVSVGEGINDIFADLGVDYIIEGGQTMNPSTEDMLSAIDKVNAKNIFIFPNNKNIVLAANQARDLVEDKNIIVIPTKTVPQGIAAMVSYVPEQSIEEIEETMKSALEYVKSGQVTYAVRDTNINGMEIKTGDIMGIDDEGIKAVGKNMKDTTVELLRNMVDEESGLISIYYGQDVTEETANEFAESIEEIYEDCDVEVQYGGQPIYYYIVSVE